MREILFRGKRVDNGKWVEGWYYESQFATYIIPDVQAKNGNVCNVEVDPATVGQYTGLQDKNGQKIFEGDIVEKTLWWRGKIDGKIRGVITFDHANYVISWNQETHISRYISSIDNMGSLEIIGNVHDNPELLEVK